MSTLVSLLKIGDQAGKLNRRVKRGNIRLETGPKLIWLSRLVNATMAMSDNERYNVLNTTMSLNAQYSRNISRSTSYRFVSLKCGMTASSMYSSNV